ncbi:MAG: hypothetical protein MMC23_005900 [Stictis urceolatum]|nr:hypothetical protein [Stictis urceolata]
MSGRRRKSLSIFRPNVSSLTPIRDSGSKETSPKEHATLKKKKLRTPSLFSSSPTSNSPSPLSSNTTPESSSPQIRPRTLQKTQRPSSILGSFKSLHSLQDEDESLIRQDTPPTTDGPEEGGTTLDVEQMQVLHHGEVQMAGSMFRKRSQYLVLTTTHLLRFKSQMKASEIFAEIPSSLGRTNSIRHSRMSSGGSFPDGHFRADPHSAIALHNVAAAYKLDDGRPYFTIELAHYDEETNYASTMNMQLSDPRDSELWLTSIRAALTKSRLTERMPFSQKAIEYCARALEYDTDYDPKQFRMFTVVQRATKSGGRSSSDDLGKLMSNIYYLVIGVHKVHLVPLPKIGKPASSTSLSDISGVAHGLMCLSHVNAQSFDDAFQLGFRTPLQQPQYLYLASTSANDIALCVRQAVEFLRPTWLEVPFEWKVPANLDEALLPIPGSDEDDYQHFDRTLIAYCVAYKVDPSNIRYTVNHSAEDAPEFQLLEPANTRRPRYYPLELLAILRSLRCNETFHSICFRGIKLDALHGLYDRAGSEHFMWSTRSGQPINLPRLTGTPLIVQELQCLALKSKRLRRLDFTDTLSRRAIDIDNANDSGSGLCEALFPLVLLQHTNVDWIILNGVALSEVDLEYIYAASIKRISHLRSVELARCGLDTEMMKICLQGLSHQGDTLETVIIAGNPALLSPDFLAKSLVDLRRVRRLDLSRILMDAREDPIIGVEILINWKLESLIMSGTTLNTQTVDAVAAYLLTQQSETLRELRMEQCQLTGEAVATIMQSMQSDRDEPRNLHLIVSENRLERNHNKLVHAIRNSITPKALTMQMLEYSNKRNFAELLSAMCVNTSLQYLDISRTSVPFDASVSVCEQLRLMFERNYTLQELNISGEQAHLEAVTLGRGLPNALDGLSTNTALRVLHIEHQELGLPGASALASALERNSTLLELYCDDNQISLQAFTTLVNAIRANKSLLYLPPMAHDRAWSRSKVDKEISAMLQTTTTTTHNPNPSSTNLALKPTPSTSSRTSAALKKTLSGGRNALSHSSRVVEKQQPIPGYTQQDVQAAVSSLDMTWDREFERLQGYLNRNFYIINGLTVDADSEMVGSPDRSRPATSGTLMGGGGGGGLVGALRAAAVDRTPTGELDRQLVFAPGAGGSVGGGTAVGREVGIGGGHVLDGAGGPIGVGGDAHVIEGLKRLELDRNVGPEFRLEDMYPGEVGFENRRSPDADGEAEDSPEGSPEEKGLEILGGREGGLVLRG